MSFLVFSALLREAKERSQQLEDEVLLLRRENGRLKTEVELLETSQQQSEELRRKSAQLEEVEGSGARRAGRWESEAKEANRTISSEKARAMAAERMEALHKQEEKTRHKLEDTGVVLQDLAIVSLSLSLSLRGM
eukprot:Skav219162  [mRNA]  locus=scaffold648:118017:123736:- [translate_table: standard]